MDRPSGLVDRTSSSQAKIALFRTLVRGREDVYPRRFESRKTGKSGYKHGLRVVGTMKSEPAMNVLAIFER
jgi:hypothetical protein